MKGSKITALFLALTMMVLGLAGCGKSVDGTYTFTEARQVHHGDMVLDMEFDWELTVEGDTYTLLNKTNASGMILISDYTGTCTVTDNKVTCSRPTGANTYTGLLDDNGNVVIDPDTPAVAVTGADLEEKINSAFGSAFFAEDKSSVWTIDTETKTTVPEGYAAP